MTKSKRKQLLLVYRRGAFVKSNKGDNFIMSEIKNPSIKLKEELMQKDYDDINYLRELCINVDDVSLKLELEYKVDKSKNKHLKDINEFMYYDDDLLIGYIGICDFGGDNLEANGMVHPDYRINGVFTKLFSLVKDEWNKRYKKSMLLLSDNNSISGLRFIKKECCIYDHSEYEMLLKNNFIQEKRVSDIKLKIATADDAKEISYQNSIYFGIEYNGESFAFPEEGEKSFIYLAMVDNTIIGKVHLEINKGIGGIYGLGVLTKYRSKGYGRQILIMAIEKLKEKNSNEIILQVEVKNSNALNLYKSCGFEETSIMDYYRMTIQNS
jgi:GNAT superfamily N-acetyltransferase